MFFLTQATPVALPQTLFHVINREATLQAASGFVADTAKWLIAGSSYLWWA
jgi:hypothetical protein